MPEGPEVRKYADALDATLTGRAIVSLEARTKDARKWLQDNEQRLRGRRVERVVSHGKHLIGYIEGRFFFHSHLMMWGRWQTFGPTKSKRKPLELPEKDRRERARIVVEGGAAILLSAPIFNVGEGDPYSQMEILSTLGPDALPYRGRFKREEFLRRLLEHRDERIGAALFNQRIVAGLGNYLRAEVLFNCKLNPWLTVGELAQRHLSCLSRVIPQLHEIHTNAEQRRGKKIENVWQTIRRWCIRSVANTARVILFFAALTCRV